MLHPIEEALGNLGYANMHYTSVSNNEEKYADRIAALKKKVLIWNKKMKNLQKNKLP